MEHTGLKRQALRNDPVDIATGSLSLGWILRVV